MRRIILIFILGFVVGTAACGEATTPTPVSGYPGAEEEASEADAATPLPELPSAVAPESDLGTFYSRVIVLFNERRFAEIPSLLHPGFEMVEFGAGNVQDGEPLELLNGAIGNGKQTLSFGDDLLDVFPYSDVAAHSGAPGRFNDPQTIALLISHHWGGGDGDAIIQIVSTESGFAIRRVFWAPAGFPDARADFVFALRNAIETRTFEALPSLMADPLAVDVAGGSGFAGAPAGVADYLAQELLPSATVSATVQAEPDLVLAELAADDEVSPADGEFTLYGLNWGADGQGRAILTVGMDEARNRYQWTRLRYYPDAATVEVVVEEEAEPETPAAPTPWPEEVEHLIGQGEWLLQVARCYGTTAAAIQAANPGLIPNQLRAGETIRIPAVGGSGPVIGPPCVIRHTVQSGEDYAAIAAQYGADAAEIQRVNGFLTLQAGTTVLVPRTIADR